MKIKGLRILLAAVLLLTTALPGAHAEGGSRLRLVATTTMLADLARQIGGEHVSVSGLMGPGIDPHLYQASAGDVTLLQGADVVLYNGLHLEGKMGELFEALGRQGRAVLCVADGLDEGKLLGWEADSSIHDPHVWFDVGLWTDAAQAVADGLGALDPENAADYAASLEAYRLELTELDAYVRARAGELSEAQRVLVTAHDAFQYFGRAYGFEVKGLQGISTDAEAGTADVSALADFIVERGIKAIFLESSVPTKTIEALQAAVSARGLRWPSAASSIRIRWGTRPPGTIPTSPPWPPTSTPL